MKREINPASKKGTPPKIVRRSMSPVEYMNSQTFKKRKANECIGVKFSYLKESNIPKHGLNKSFQKIAVFQNVELNTPKKG